MLKRTKFTIYQLLRVQVGLRQIKGARNALNPVYNLIKHDGYRVKVGVPLTWYAHAEKMVTSI